MRHNETMAERDAWRERVEKAEHMAALWKRLAKMYLYAIENVYEPQADAQLERICQEQAELAALKKDARMLAEMVNSYIVGGVFEVDWEDYVDRILEATKEKP